MSFIYPRTISVTRSNVPVVNGASAYSGVEASEETTIANGIPCSIQMKVAKGKPPTGLPADAIAETSWRIYIPAYALALGAVNTHDIVTDDLGARYQIVANYWNSLGYALLAEKLET